MNQSVTDTKAIAKVASAIRISAKNYSVADIKGIVRVAKGLVIVTDADLNLSVADMKGIAGYGRVQFE